MTTIGLSNLLFGLLGVLLIGLTFFLITKWQKGDSQITKAFTIAGLVCTAEGLIFSVIGAASSVAINASGMLVVIICAAVLTGFTVSAAKLAYGNYSDSGTYVNVKAENYGFALFCVCLFFFIACGLTIIIAANFAVAAIWYVILSRIVSVILTRIAFAY